LKYVSEQVQATKRQIKRVPWSHPFLNSKCQGVGRGAWGRRRRSGRVGCLVWLFGIRRRHAPDTPVSTTCQLSTTMAGMVVKSPTLFSWRQCLMPQHDLSITGCTYSTRPQLRERCHPDTRRANLLVSQTLGSRILKAKIRFNEATMVKAMSLSADYCKPQNKQAA
jgi:hypothetical protein